MKILHLGFEDHRRPGAGGGSLRNQEVNRRLTASHEIEVVTAAYAGCRDREEDGVHYTHAGAGDSRVTSALSYLAALPWVVRRSSADLVIEDFAPPFASIGVPRWSRKPTVGMVQWHFARETARRYGFAGAPFAAIERWATKGHTDLIVPSQDLARKIRAITRRPAIYVVDLGVDVDAYAAEPEPVPGRIAFLGRLDMQHKGLDLLAAALNHVPPEQEAHILIAGDGRDREVVERGFKQVRSVRVEFVGRVIGFARWNYLRSAQVIAMPSRWETYGLVALEAFACGAPVVAFDIPSLRETVIPEAGHLVTPFDVRAFGTAIANVLADPEGAAAMGAAGRAYARRFTWDEVARVQEDIYMQVASRDGALTSRST